MIDFVIKDNSDAILIATEHTTGGKVELWELDNTQQPLHKTFAIGTDFPTQRIASPVSFCTAFHSK